MVGIVQCINAAECGRCCCKLATTGKCSCQKRCFWEKNHKTVSYVSSLSWLSGFATVLVVNFEHLVANLQLFFCLKRSFFTLCCKYATGAIRYFFLKRPKRHHNSGNRIFSCGYKIWHKECSGAGSSIIPKHVCEEKN